MEVPLGKIRLNVSTDLDVRIAWADDYIQIRLQTEEAELFARRLLEMVALKNAATSLPTN